MEQAYLDGFIKRAADYGISSEEATSLLKSAVVGIGADVALAGAPSGIGALLGGNYAPISNKELEEEMAYSEDPSLSKALKYLLVPGYTGYRLAKNNRLEHAFQKYKDTQRGLTQ
jgi:hypothetical protein